MEGQTFTAKGPNEPKVLKLDQRLSVKLKKNKSL
jgi:hypothetical protein